MITKNENLGKISIHNNQSYEGRIGFNKDGDSCVKWYKLTGHRNGTILTLHKEGKSIIFGKEVVPYN